MAKKTKEKEINLLPKEEFETSTIGRTIKWLLTSFRYIVIVTEMVVMSAFLSRFYLDARAADLIDSINQKKSIISSYSNFEGEFRKTQDKLKTFDAFAADNEKLSPLMSAINSSVPSDLTLSQIAVSTTSIQINGITENENSITNFMANLNKTSLFNTLALPTVETKEGSSNLSFTISANLTERSQSGESQ